MLLISLVLLGIAALFVTAPVMVAARIVGAGRNGFWICLLALVVSWIIVGIAVRLFHGGGLLSFLVAPVGYMWILDTTYLRGLAMVILQALVSALIVFILLFTALGSTLHLKDMVRDLPVTGPSQSV